VPFSGSTGIAGNEHTQNGGAIITYAGERKLPPTFKEVYMRIQHNIAALSSYRNLTNNNNAVSKSLEKLSSGYRINRAGDDAAGLSIF